MEDLCPLTPPSTSQIGVDPDDIADFISGAFKLQGKIPFKIPFKRVNTLTCYC